MTERRQLLRHTFETAADLYEAARPSYPPKLFEDLVRLAHLAPGASLLEIGCGTGKATRLLLERGFSVVCVELALKRAATTESCVSLLRYMSLPLRIRVEAEKL